MAITPGPVSGLVTALAVIFAALHVQLLEPAVIPGLSRAPEALLVQPAPAPRPKARRRRSPTTTPSPPLAAPRKRRKVRARAVRQSESSSSSSWTIALISCAVGGGSVAAFWWLKPRPAPLSDFAPGLGDDGRASPPRKEAPAVARLVAGGSVTLNDPRILDFLAAAGVRR